MIEFYKRCWHVFLPLFGIFVIGIIPAIHYLDGKRYQWDVIIVLIILAIIFLIIGLIGFIKAFKYARKEERETQATKNHEALKESFRRLHPEWTEEQVEIAATGTPSALPIEGEEEWMSPKEAYRKRQK
jgi:uncharacterized membrane protein